MSASGRDRETAEDVVRAEWLHAVDTGAIIDYGSQDAVHAAMDHMADAFADAVIAVLDGPQSPPSGPGRAEDGGRVSSGGSTLRTNNVTTKLGGA